MKKTPLLALVLPLLALAFAGCESTPQGPAPAVNTQPVTPLGERIEPKPESKAFPQEKDVFRGATYQQPQLPANAKRITMRVGQVTEVYRGSFAPGDGQHEMAFYLPVEARSVVQLVVETKGFTRSYFLRAIGVGDTAGGVVERRWLNAQGYDPKDTAAEARIQDAVRAQPYIISVY